MNPKFNKYIGRFTLKPGASVEEVKHIETQLGIAFPNEYLEFMRDSNGAVGSIGPSDFLVLWPIEDIPKANDQLNVIEVAPGLLLFGSDGGGTLYGFDLRSSKMAILEVPDIPL